MHDGNLEQKLINAGVSDDQIDEIMDSQDDSDSENDEEKNKNNDDDSSTSVRYDNELEQMLISEENPYKRAQIAAKMISYRVDNFIY